MCNVGKKKGIQAYRSLLCWMDRKIVSGDECIEEAYWCCVAVAKSQLSPKVQREKGKREGCEGGKVCDLLAVILHQRLSLSKSKKEVGQGWL